MYLIKFFELVLARSGDSPGSLSTAGTSYCAATGGALATALGLNSLVAALPPLVGRLVPFIGQHRVL